MVADASSDIPQSIKAKIATRGIKKRLIKNSEGAWNLIIAYMLLLFIMLGYIANALLRRADEELLFLWRYFNPMTWIQKPLDLTPFMAFAVVFFLLGTTENLFPYCARKAIILAILMIVTAGGFHQLLHPSEISILIFFTRWEGYVTIIVLVIAGLFFSWLGTQLRLFNYRRKKREINYLNGLSSIDRNEKISS